MKKIFILLAVLLLLPAVHASGLAFSDMEVEVDGETDDNVNAAGGSFEAAPGESIELTVEVMNDYASTTEDHKIKHIDVSIDVETFCSHDLDDSIEEDIRINDLEPDSDDDAVFRFQIPDCANEGNYDLDVSVDGKDENGTEYAIEETITISVDKDASSMIMDFSIDSAMSCETREITVTVEAHNLGSMDEDAGLLIINDDLDINRFEFMDLRTGKWTDEDTQFLTSYTFDIDDTVEPGEYNLRAEIEYTANPEGMARYVTVVVPECVAEEAVPEEESKEPAEEIPVEEPAQTEETQQEAVVAPQQTLKDEGLFSIPVLIGALIAGMIVLGILVIMLRKQ
jgi:hypothetical protein